MHVEIPMSREEKRTYELECIMELADQLGGVVRTKDILNLGIDYRRVVQFIKDGDLLKVRNGSYTVRTAVRSEDELIAAMFPDGVLTMQSGLYLHGYLKEKPYGWAIAISKNTSKSRFKMTYPVVEPYYTEEAVLDLGMETIELAGKTMRVYSKERLICDVLKYEEKLDRKTLREGVFSYIEDESKDIACLMEMAAKRKVRKKVQSMIGVWL